MIYLLRDDFDGSEELARLKEQFGDQASRELNTTTLDGRALDLDDLLRACESSPFLADRRLVIVRRLLARLQPKGARPGPHPSASQRTATATPSSDQPQDVKGKTARSKLGERLCGYLERVPEFVDLVFVEDAAVGTGHPVYKAIQKAGGRIVQRAKPLRGEELVEWVALRVKKRGGRIARSATEGLAAYGGEDRLSLDNDVEKLVIYAGAREITLEDVHALVSDAREASIFAFVDAVGEGNGKRALTVLHSLLFDGSAPAYILSMITRQFRLLLLARELGAPSPDEVASRLQLQRFVAQKVVQQARRFSLERLEGAYRAMVEADAAIKTGRMEADTALDLLVVDLSMARS